MLNTKDYVTKCPRYRVFFCSIICAFILFVTLVDFIYQLAPFKTPLRKLKLSNDSVMDLKPQDLEEIERRWEKEYEDRLRRVQNMCTDENLAKKRVWPIATNRLFGKESYCQTRFCPIIIDVHKELFFCFVPKVASSRVKTFFMNISGITLNDTLRNNNTALHQFANNILYRVSPMYYSSTRENRFFKIIFVRHPFDRLVSAFRSQAKLPRDQLQYFYDRYWDPVLKKIRPKGSDHSFITFREFIWYLTHSMEIDFDDEWVPYSSRCDPCLVDYDFVGKLETADHDFPYAFQKVGIIYSSEWWKGVQSTPHSLSLRYFAEVPEEDIRSLYQIYRLDFELFGYSINEFLPGKRSGV